MRRKVTVDNTKAAPDSVESRRPSVFERLGPGSSRESARDAGHAEQGRSWGREGSSSFGNTSRFQQGQRNRSPEAEPVDLRHRVESKRAERERERDRDRSTSSSSLSPPLKDKMKYKAHHAKETSSDRKRKGQGSKVTKLAATPSPEVSEAEGWGGIDGIPAADDDMWDDEANLDYRQALTLELKRQQIQRELQQMEEEENQAREQAEHILQKEGSDDDRAGSYRSSRSPSPVRKKHPKKKKGRNKADKRCSPSPEDQSPPTSYAGKKRKRRKSEDTTKQDREGSSERPTKKKGGGPGHSPRGSKAMATAHQPLTPSPKLVKQGYGSDSDTTPRKYKGKAEMRKKSKDRDVAKRRSFSGNKSSDEEAASARRKLAHSPTPPAQYRKATPSAKRLRSPSHSRSPSPVKQRPKHYETPPQRVTRRVLGTPSPARSGSFPPREHSSQSTSSSTRSESPRRATGKRPRYQSPSPLRQTKQPSSSPRERRGRPRSPPVRSPASARTGVKKQLQRSLSPAGSHRSYSPASKRRSPSPRSARRPSPSPSQKQPPSRLARSSSGSRDNAGKKYAGRHSVDYQGQKGHPSGVYQTRGDGRNDLPPADFQQQSRQRSDSRSDHRADGRALSRGQPKTDSRGYQRGDVRDDPLGARRGDTRGDIRGDTRRDARGSDPKLDPRGDPRADVRGNLRVDTRGNPRQESREDPRADLRRGNPRGDLRGDPRGERRGDTRVDPRADPRGSLREDMRGDPRDVGGNLRGDPRGDLRGDPRASPRGDLRGNPRGYRGVDPRDEFRGDLREDLRGDPRVNLRGDLMAEVRGDPRGDIRGDMRGGLRSDPRADPRGDVRRDLRSDPRVDPRSRVEPRADPRSDLKGDPRRNQRDDPRLDPMADLRLAPRADPRVDLRPDLRVDQRSGQRLDQGRDSREPRGRQQQERESRRDEWERSRNSGRKEMEDIPGRDQQLARNRGQSSLDRQRDVPRSDSLDNRRMPKASPSPLGRGRGPNAGRGPERDPAMEKRDKGQERGRGQMKGRDPPAQKGGRGLDPGKGNQRGRGSDRSGDRGRGGEMGKSSDGEKVREPLRGKDGALERDRSLEKGRDGRGVKEGQDLGRTQEREGFARQADSSFRESRRSRESSTDSRKMDKQKGTEQLQRGMRTSGQSEAGRRDLSRERLEDSRSRRGDSRSSSSSRRDKPSDQDKRQRSERSSERSSRDLPKQPRPPGRAGLSDSPATVGSRSDRSHSREKSIQDPDQKNNFPPPDTRAIEALSKSSTQDSKESTPLKEGSPSRPAEEVFSDWSEGGSDELLNQSPPEDDQEKLLPSSADTAATTKQDPSVEPLKRERQRSDRQDRRSDDREKQEGVEGRSLRSQSYGSSSSRYSSISSDIPVQSGSAASLEQGSAFTRTAVDQEEVSSTTSPMAPSIPKESKASREDTREKETLNKNISMPPSRETSVKREQSNPSDMYEVISDDEFDEMLDDAKKDGSKQDEETKSQEDTQADLTAVDWSSLMSQTSLLSQSKPGGESGSILDKFRPGQVLARVGVSRALAGPELMGEVERVCQQAAQEEGSTLQTPMFENQLGAFNASAQRKLRQRKHLLTDIGPCRRALCARWDVMIRKQLGKADKPEPDQVFSSSLLDAELFKVNVQLFRAGKKSGPAPDPTGTGASAPNSDRSSPVAVCT